MDVISKKIEKIDEEEYKHQNNHDLSARTFAQKKEEELDIKSHPRNKSQDFDGKHEITINQDEVLPSLRKIKEAPFDAKNNDMSIDLATISRISSKKEDQGKDLLKVNERREKRKLTKTSKTLAELPNVSRQYSSLATPQK